MTFVIVTHTKHIRHQGDVYAYGPYVREMNIWGRYVDKVIVVAPISEEEPSDIHIRYDYENIVLRRIPAISFISFSESLRALFLLPVIGFRILRAMMASDHIHLRCPGNIGLMGCFVQMWFPGKSKTAKYAGNWDPNAQQPFSYRLQKKILSNTFFTRKMQVLAYGDWPNQTKNIKPFFTATYPKSKAQGVQERTPRTPWKFIFVGGLTTGKRPLYAIKLIYELRKRGEEVTFDLFGDGVEREALEQYVLENQLSDVVTLHGNQTAQRVETAYHNADFLILPSRSEGWPKAVAEAMFWGCIPVATRVSCVPWMLNEGERGVLLEMEEGKDVDTLLNAFNDPGELKKMAAEAQRWSQQYTLDDFESEIKELL